MGGALAGRLRSFERREAGRLCDRLFGEPPSRALFLFGATKMPDRVEYGICSKVYRQEALLIELASEEELASVTYNNLRTLTAA